MGYKTPLFRLRISTRLFLLNLIIYAAIFTVAGLVLFSAGLIVWLALLGVFTLVIAANLLLYRTINRPMNTLLTRLKSFPGGPAPIQLDFNRNDEWSIIESAFNKISEDLSTSLLALSNSENKYRDLAELLPQPVFELDPEGAFTFSNQKASEIFGYGSDELLNGIHVYQLLDPVQIDRFHKTIQSVLDGAEMKGEETAALKKDGSLVPILVYCAPIRNQGQITGLRGTVVDITERKQVEKELAEHRDLLEVLVEKRTVALRQVLSELRESEELYRNLTTQMHDGFLILNEYNMFEYINPSMLTLMGYTWDELINTHISRFYTPENRPVLGDAMTEMLTTGEGVRFEARFISKDKRLITFMVTGRPEKKDGRLNRIYGICTDISKLKESEKALKENQENLEEKIRIRTRELEIARDKAERANELKNEFLANVSHELRTPMHAILGYSKFGVKKIDIKSKERIREYFTNIYLSGKRLLVFLNDLLDLSSLQAEKIDYHMQNYNLRRTFCEMKKEVLPLLQEKELYLTIEEEPPIMAIFDEMKIKQVISNLFSNAIKFADFGSDIIVEFEEEPDQVTVMIKNQGVQIPVGELKTIFDPFVQSSITKTGAGGTGLGLPICKKIVVYHGGDIWAEENLQGATIRFYLPKNQRELQEKNT